MRMFAWELLLRLKITFFFFLFPGEEMRGLSQKSRFSYGTCCTEREEESGSDAER